MTERPVLELSDEWMPADPVLASKFRFYMELDEKERTALDFLLMNIRFKTDDKGFSSAVMASGLRKKEVEALAKRSIDAGILRYANYNFAIDADRDFLIFAYPFFKERKVYFSRDDYYLSYDVIHTKSAVIFIGEALDRMSGYEPDEDAEIPKYYLGKDFADLIWKAVGYAHYKFILPYFDLDDLREACSITLMGIMTSCGNLIMPGEAYSEYSDIDLYKKAAAGDFDGLMTSVYDESGAAFAAASSIFLKEDDPVGTAEFFEKGLRVLRRRRKKCQTPDDPLWIIYYLCFILTKLPVEYIPILEKICGWEDSDSIARFWFIHKMCIVCMDQTDNANHDTILGEGRNYSDPDLAVGAACTYLAGSVPSKYVINTIAERAADMAARWNSALAMEMLYAVSRWSRDEAFQNLYKEIRGRVGFDPALSKIKGEDDWERALDNLTLMITGVDPAGHGPSEIRMGYIIDLEKLDIQPIVQKRLARGGWSAGKRIPLKDMQKKGEPGMTEADLRVASHIKTTS